MYLTNVKIKILIASYLKPVNDIRSFEKMALSIAKNNRYQVYTLGYPVSSETSDKNVVQIPLNKFKKNGIARIKARLQALNIYLKLKPEVIIVNSTDLLLITVAYKILFGAKIVYDIQENYFRNLWYQTNYPIGLRHVLAIIIRTKETLLSPFFNHFLLAEKVYTKQLNFIGNRFTVIENKSLIPSNIIHQKPIGKPIQFLISGTLAKEYGVFEGIHFFEFIKSRKPDSKLLIIGHCANAITYARLEKLARKINSIELKISSTPVSHSAIEQAILKSDIGLLPYIPNKSTQGKWPTKLFEYMSYKLPLIIQTNSTWNEFLLKNSAGFYINFTEPKNYLKEPIEEKLLKQKFYQHTLSDTIYWLSEEVKLLKVLDNFIN